MSDTHTHTHTRDSYSRVEAFGGDGGGTQGVHYEQTVGGDGGQSLETHVARE